MERPCGGASTLGVYLFGVRAHGPRCEGLMVHEIFVHDLAVTTPISFSGCRCLGCGAICDPLIVRHEANRPEPPHC